MKKAPKSSRITVPQRAHPLARLVFSLMRKTSTSYFELEMRSGILLTTMKAWRSANVPSLTSMEAALGSFGWRLVPCPPLEDLPDHVREQLEEAGQHFVNDDQAIAAAIAAAVTTPGARGDRENPAPRLEYRRATWPEAFA